MVAKKEGKRALGRGLDALFGEVSVTSPGSADSGRAASGANKTEERSEGGISYIPIDDIKPNSAQPRQVFSKESLDGLSDSIKKHGMIQPVIVKKIGKRFELVAGERRWRAAKKAGFKDIPAMLREVTPEENTLLALIENMQRENLNPLEEAGAYRRIIDEHGLTQEEISKSVGKSRPYISNTLRLLKLPEKIKEYISEGQISPGHANAIGSLSSEKSMQTLAERIVKDGLSVREAEAIAQSMDETGKKPRKNPAKAYKNPELKAIEEELTSLFGTRVTIGKSTVRGAIEIHYYSRDELDGLIEELMSFKR